MKRILNVALGLFLVAFGVYIGIAGGYRFFPALTAMAERPLQGDEATNMMMHVLTGLALIALAFWAVTSGWKRLKLGVLPASASAAAPTPVAVPAAAAPTPPQTAVPAARPKAAVVTLLYGGRTVRLAAADGEATLGRGAECRVVIASQQVSRAHARIAWDATGAPRLVNLSKAGTSVRAKGESGYRACETEIPLTDEGMIAFSADGAGAAERGEVVHFAVLR